MFDLPLHPIVVHFPIVLGFILPFAGFAFWWAIKKDFLPQRVWVLITALALVYGASALVASELGEKDEDKVEKVVSEKLIEEHEEAAELVPWIAGTLLLVSLAGLRGKNAQRARLAFAIVSLAATIPLANAGHTGGELVYKYGAANAHLPVQYRVSVKVPGFDLESEEDHDDEHEKGEH